MTPKTKVLSYNLTDSFKAHILLTPSSKKSIYLIGFTH